MAAFARIGFCLLMSKTFRPWTIDQPLLLPPSVQDFVGEDHLARFILALVLERLDLGEIEAAYASERGQPPFDPAMMTALLLYGYCHGVYSSRRIAKATRERVDFLSIVGLDPPDFRTVSDFRKRHLKALAGLFGQVLKLCEQAGFVKLGHVALDGTKIKANASKHKAMSYERMEKRAARRCGMRGGVSCHKRAAQGHHWRARDRLPSSSKPSLSSDAKCNTPRRFDIGKVVQDLKECCHAILFASLGRRKRPNRHFAGPRGGRWEPLPGRSVGRKPRSPGATAERTLLGRVFTASRRRSLSIAQAA